LPHNKAPGCDNKKIEIFKAIKDDITPAITNLCNEVWKKVKWLSEWKESFFSFYERTDVRECTNNRIIALIPHTRKILLRIVQK